MKFVVDNVRPHLDYNYRTLKIAANTLVGGVLRGGLSAFT
jgi:enterochelin esterase-like enzyme